MATVNTSVTNGVSMGYKAAVGTTSATEGEITIDFGVSYDIVAAVQIQKSTGENRALSDLVITYPANGQVKVANNLITSLALVNDLKSEMNDHAADDTEHAAADDVNFPVATTDATDLDSLLDLAGDLLTAYDGHDADAEEGSPSYHNATEAGDHSLTSAVAPTTLAEAITRLNDLKAKFNAHDADDTAHTTGSTYQIAVADAASTFALGATDIINVIAQRNKTS